MAGHDVVYWRRGDSGQLLGDCTTLIAAVPAQATRAVLSDLAPHLSAEVPLVLTAKGLEKGTLKRQSEIAAEVLPGHPIAVLSGPSFAADLHAGLPTAVTLATQWAGAESLQTTLATSTLRPYLTDDVVGAEIGGALKNVFAIACGIAIGAGLGESARAALLARGFAEMVRLATAVGARPETLAGLSGLGDLTLTCTSSLSRNFSFGRDLGMGRAAGAGSTVEGRDSARAIAELADRHGVEVPIIGTVAALVQGELGMQKAVENLTNRPLRRE